MRYLGQMFNLEKTIFSELVKEFELNFKNTNSGSQNSGFLAPSRGPRSHSVCLSVSALCLLRGVILVLIFTGNHTNETPQTHRDTGHRTNVGHGGPFIMTGRPADIAFVTAGV